MVVPIGEVQKLTNLSARQIRYYERLGLVSPARTGGRQRLFSDRDVARLKQIERLHAEGLSLTAIKVRLDGPDDDALRRRLEGSDAHFRLQAGGLTSLYPISNRAELERFIDTKKREDETRDS